MAELLPVLEFALRNLSTFLVEEGRVLGEIRSEVQLICDEFGHIKAFLQKVSDLNQEDDPQLTVWIGQVREVSNDTEYILTDLLLLYGGRQLKGFRGLIDSIKNSAARLRLNSKLQRLKARIRNISEARLRYDSRYTTTLPGVLGSVDNVWMHSKDDDALLVEEAQLVGINERKKDIISQLLEVYSPIKVIAVVGMGGLGKTTLVRKVYDDAAVKERFQIRAWVPVSQRCNFQELLKGLIQQLLAQFNEPVLSDMDSMDTYRLKVLVKDILRRGRYVIVFDDVWNPDFWDAVKFALPVDCYSGNCVMLTTRIADVASASIIDSPGYKYDMEYLNFQDSWTLFCQKIFRDKLCPPHLVSVARKMVAKCGGLPLAIIAIAGLLASKDWSRESEWELVQQRLGDEFERGGRLDRVKRILSLSYNDLTSSLKDCLLYTSIYPEDHMIPCHHLIHLWVAERLVERKEGRTAEEVSWDYLKELANRSFIQFDQVLYNGLYDYLSIHDILREFIALKSKEQNMVTIMNTTHQIPTECSLRKAMHRIVFHDNLHEIVSPKSEHDANNFRSIINFGGKSSPSKAVLTELLRSELLSVLDLRGIDLEEVPKRIFTLFRLKLLALSGKKIKKVPKSIKNLQNLEYLGLQETNIKELPMEINKLDKLRHLLLLQQITGTFNGDMFCNGFKAPRRIGELLELQTLSTIDAASNDKTGVVNEIGKLAKLRKLWIKNLRREDGKELCSSLSKLSNLQELVVASLGGKDELLTLELDLNVSASFLKSLCWLELFGRLEKLPPWIKNLQGLERLTLSLSNLAQDPFRTLHQLPNLIEVCFAAAYQGESLYFQAGCFLKLKKLTMKHMKGLKRVVIKEGAMPFINQLTMHDLPSVTELPFGIEHLRQLQKVELLEMSSELSTKLSNAAYSETESENYRKISHIPQVIIGFLVDGRMKCRQLSSNKASQLVFQVEEILDAKVIPDTKLSAGLLSFVFAMVVTFSSVPLHVKLIILGYLFSALMVSLFECLKNRAQLCSLFFTILIVSLFHSYIRELYD